MGDHYGNNMDNLEQDVPTFSDIAKKFSSPGRLYYTQDEMAEIYTDWANHYLERSPRHKRFIQDLQQDITDGVLLADVIEAVTNERLRDIKQKPKTDAQILENITVCLKCIDNLGVNTEGLQAEDIKNGNLRAILGLFFSLSRYKQQKKAVSQQYSTTSVQPAFPSVPPHLHHPAPETMLPKLPSPFKSTNTNRNSTGAIPQNVNVAAAGGQNRRSLTNAEKERTTSNGFSSGILPPRHIAQNSRPISPGASGSPHSLIPPPSSKLPLPSDKGNRQNRSSSSISSSVSTVSSTSKGPLPAVTRSPAALQPILPSSIPSSSPAAAMGKNSVFGFTGFFHKNKQEKHAPEKVTKTNSTERNSDGSSSGFSSAKSADNSDSSVTGSEQRISSPTVRREITLNGNLQKEIIYETTTATTVSSSPKMAIKALARKTFSKSPAKDSPKLLRVEHRDAENKATNGNIVPTIPTGKVPPQVVAGDAERKMAKLSSALNKPETRLSRRELPRLPDAQIPAVAEEEPTASNAALARRTNKPIGSTKVEIVTVRKSPNVSGKVTPITPTTPTSSSGIPKPSSLNKSSASASVKAGKPEKRLSFPPGESVGAATAETASSADAVSCTAPSQPVASKLPVDTVATDMTGSNCSSHIHRPASRENTKYSIESANQECNTHTVNTDHLPSANNNPATDVQQRGAEFSPNSPQSQEQRRPDVPLCHNAAPDNSGITTVENVWTLGHSVETTIDSTPDNKVSSTTKTALDGVISPSQHVENAMNEEKRTDCGKSGRSTATLVSGIPQPEMTPSAAPTGTHVPNRGLDMNHSERSHAASRTMPSYGKVDGMKHFSSLTRSTNHHGDHHHAGYLSDGDTLKSSNMTPQLRFFDADSTSGYISEGNAGNHQKRMSTKKEKGAIGRLDLDECATNDISDKGKSFFDRDSTGSNSGVHRGYPYSSLGRYPNTQTSNGENGNIQHPVAAMPLLRGSGSKRMEDGGRRPPVTPPPRDPETTLSTHSRFANGCHYSTKSPVNNMENYSKNALHNNNNSMTNGSQYSAHASANNVDNYLRIYASPVRKPRIPASDDVFPERSGRHPGELFTRPLNTETATLMNEINNSANSKSMGNALERRTKLKVSGSTQTSPQELQLKMQTLNANQYTTNSLNRNINRHPVNGNNAFYSPPDSQQGPPRCRSVVQQHHELSLPTATPIFFEQAGNNQGNVPASPARTRSTSSTSARLSMPNQAQELSILNIDPDRYDATDNLSLNAALPPKSQRHMRQPNGPPDSNIYDKINHNGLCSKSGSINQNNYVDIQYQSSEHNPPGMTVWERSPSHTLSGRSESRGHPLSYSMNTHQQNHLDDLDASSTASFPLTGISRSSAPGSPLLMYNLPRSGQNSLNLRATPGLSPYVGSLLAKIHSKNDEMHGSAGSLASTTSSMYSSPEERHAYEVRKLRKELEQAQERVTSLTTQLSTNTHVVAAFENSLNNMTQRLENLTAHSYRKDGELLELRRIIDVLRQQGTEAGLISGNGNPISPNLVRRHTFNSTKDVLSDNPEKHHQGLSRQLSTDSVASLNSNCSNASHQLDEESKKKKKKSWIRSSLSKAFSRSKTKSKNDGTSDGESVRNGSIDLSSSVPNSPLMQNNRNASRIAVNGQIVQRNGHGHLKPANSSSALDRMDENDETTLFEDLQRQLREKDMTLTDFQLQAVKSAQQLDQYKEDMLRMRNEIEILRQDNMRLHRLVAVKRRSLSSERKSPHDGGARSTPSESGIGDDESPTFDARRIAVKVIAIEDGNAANESECDDMSIGSVNIGPLLRWEQLDRTVRQLFKEYVSRVDYKRDQAEARDQANLGLTVESIAGYHLGTALRNRDEPPTSDSSPIDYLKCDDEKIRIILRGSRDHAVDTIAFESLIPKSFFQRYISLLTEHKRVILCGPSGTGKSYLARKMAQHIVLKSGKKSTEGSVATFNVDQKSSKELRQYLLQIAEQCENSSQTDVPSVVIIDNLHHVGSLGEVFNGFLSVKHHRCPFIIGTMNQATCSPANLQLHHNFRWILCANHMEPVKGFLGRYLRRKIMEHELSVGVCDSALTKIIDWIPRAWQHINTFLEKHSSSDVTVGPRLFLECPMNVRNSQDWFTLLWNYSLVPYILEAVKEGLQLYGRCVPTWEDPVEWILDTYPWPFYDREDDHVNHGLNRLRPEDVGFETYGVNNGTKSTALPFADDVSTDPLSHMLMQLQEAALYSTNQNNLEIDTPKLYLGDELPKDDLSMRS